MPNRWHSSARTCPKLTSSRGTPWATKASTRARSESTSVPSRSQMARSRVAATDRARYRRYGPAMVEYELQGHVAVLTINRPKARNAVSTEVAQGLEAAIDRLEEDDD